MSRHQKPWAERDASQIYVDGKGLAHDDEGNSWKVGLPSGHYDSHRVPMPPVGRSTPSHMDKTDAAETQRKAWGILLGMFFDGKSRDRSWAFVKERTLSSKALSPKQAQWFDRLASQYRTLIQKAPRGLLEGGVGTSSSYMVVNKKYASWVKKHFDTEDFGGALLKLLGPKTEKTVAPAQDPAQMLNVLAEYLTKNPNNQFMASIRDQVARGRALSEKQLKAVRQNLYRAGMRSDAAVFKTAREVSERTPQMKNPSRKASDPVFGPFFEMKGHTCKTTWGPYAERSGRWSYFLRFQRVAKTGELTGKEHEAFFQGSDMDTLWIYRSARTQEPVPVKNLGTKNPVAAKSAVAEFKSLVAKYKGAAEKAFAQISAATAHDFVGEILDDTNWHSLARLIPSSKPFDGDDKWWDTLKKMKALIHYDPIVAAAVGFTIMKKAKDAKTAKLLEARGGEELVRFRSIRSSGKRNLFARIDEADMNRAANLLRHMDERAATKHLVKEGMSSSDAMLAVKAGKLLDRDRQPKQAGYKFPLGTVLAFEDSGGYFEAVVSTGGDRVTQWENIPYLNDPKLSHQEMDTPINKWNPRPVAVHVVIPGKGKFLSVPHMTKKFLEWRKAQYAAKQAGYKGNPDGKDIYPNEIGHGYGEPLAGGTDVMRKLQNQLLHEQGDTQPQRPDSPRLSAEVPEISLRGRWVTVNKAFVTGIKKMHKNHILEGSPRGGFTLVHPASDKDRDFEGGSEYDFYFRPSKEKGMFDVGYQPGYLILLQKDGDKMKAVTNRLASAKHVASRYLEKLGSGRSV